MKKWVEWEPGEGGNGGKKGYSHNTLNNNVKKFFKTINVRRKKKIKIPFTIAPNKTCTGSACCKI